VPHDLHEQDRFSRLVELDFEQGLEQVLKAVGFPPRHS
jgi:hypothetical protein